MKRPTTLTTRLLLVSLPLAGAACSTTPRQTVQTVPPPTFEIVDEPGEAPIETYAQQFDPVGHGYDGEFSSAGSSRSSSRLGDALPISFGDRRARTDTGQVSLIGLYGEIAPNTWGASDPYDGGKNLSQVSFADEGACFDPDIDRSGEWLVFASTRHRDTADLYMKSATGKTITQITSDPADDLMPNFDPTSKQIAFASNRSGNWDIFITTPEGGRAIQLTSSSDDELHPSWSPDGRTIAYCKFGSQSGRWEIWCVDVHNTAVHRFLDYGLFPQWCPDVTRSKLLFQRSRQRGSRFHSIWTLDMVNGESRYPTEIVSAANAAVINPTWSPDGRRIAFVTIVDPNEDESTPVQSDVWIVNTDGTNRTMLTNGQFANYQPVWSPAGSVFFVSNRSGVENIWAVGMTATGGFPDTHDSGIANVDPDQVGPPIQP